MESSLEAKQIQEIKEMLEKVDLSKWQIKPEEVEIDRTCVLGRGAFGKVYKGKCRGKAVAVKRLYRQNLKYVIDLILEVDTMSQLLHPNVLLFMAVCTEIGSLMIITEFMEKGSVDTLLKREPDLSLGRRLGFCRDAALGMNWLHSCTPPVLHRDLKPSNLLVDGSYNVKVCDFGLSIHKVEEWSKEKPKGSPLYMAPECLLGQACDEKTDVYSFGYVVWEIVTRQMLFPTINDEKTLRETVCIKQQKPPIPQDVPKSVQDIMRNCWKHPTERPTFKQLCDDLDHALVDCLVEDHNARIFWKRYFLGRDSVPWSQFQKKLEEFLELGTMEEALANSLLGLLGISKKKEENVQLSKFAEILKWFGPMKGQTKEDNFLEKYQFKFLTLKGFHPTATRESSSQLLDQTDPGTYLFRFGSRPGDFVLVRHIAQGKNSKMYRLVYSYDPNGTSQGTFTFEDKSVYASLEDFLENLKKLNISVGSPLLCVNLDTGIGYDDNLQDNKN